MQEGKHGNGVLFLDLVLPPPLPLPLPIILSSSLLHGIHTDS